MMNMTGMASNGDVQYGKLSDAEETHEGKLKVSG